MWTGSTRVLFGGTIKIKTASFHGTYNLTMLLSAILNSKRHFFKCRINCIYFENIVTWAHVLTVLNHKTNSLAISEESQIRQFVRTIFVRITRILEKHIEIATWKSNFKVIIMAYVKFLTKYSMLKHTCVVRLFQWYQTGVRSPSVSPYQTVVLLG